eukprot:2541696-Rhodomonas_salina.1
MNQITDVGCRSDRLLSLSSTFPFPRSVFQYPPASLTAFWGPCRYLSEILPKNLTLQKLYLGYNDIKDDGVYALIAGMCLQSVRVVPQPSGTVCPYDATPCGSINCAYGATRRGGTDHVYDATSDAPPRSAGGGSQRQH